MLSRQHDDELLIKKAKKGDTEAFGLLYEQYAEIIFRYVFSHLDSKQDAEDLTEEIFFRAWKALPNYDDRGLPFSAFLFRSARNSLIDYYRQYKVVKSLDEIEWQSNGEPDPEDEVAARMDRADLKQTLSQLREDYRTVLIFRFLGGMSPEETAEVMDRSVGAVRVLQHRALSALKNLLVRGSDD